MSLKKILIILIILLIIVIGILVVYNFFLKKEPAISPGTETPSQTRRPSLSTQIKAISQESVLGTTIDGQKVKYYTVSNGNVFESSFDGSGLTRISSNLLPGLLKVLWSANKDKVIAVFEDKGQTKKYFYDYNTGVSTALDRNIRWVSWSPHQDKIAYQYYNSQTQDNNISIANPDGSEWTNILPTRMKNLIVEWPSPNKVSLRTRPSGLAQSVVYLIDLTNNNFEKILNETYGLTVLWSPLADKILFSETDNQGKNLKLKIADLTKSTIKELNLVTLPEKCVWSQDNRTLFCAVPKSISKLAVLPDDYYKGKISLADDFWRINLDSEEATQIFKAEDEESTAYDAQELLLSPQEDYLLFINKKDGLLYSLKL
jgi:hypothetical protein